MIPASLSGLLRDLHSAPGRAYHGWGHVEALLAALDAERGFVEDPRAAALAILFHDAVHDPRRRDNEERSADLARRLLGGEVEATTVERACRAILATAGHRVPPGLPAGEASDVARFLDWDLAILGAGPAAFAAYEAAIRSEYAHVPDEAYRRGRGAVLGRFLARPAIFLTEPSRGRLEARARANLAAAVGRLSLPQGPAPA